MVWFFLSFRKLCLKDFQSIAITSSNTGRLSPRTPSAIVGAGTIFAPPFSNQNFNQRETYEPIAGNRPGGQENKDIYPLETFAKSDTLQTKKDTFK